MSKTSTRKSLAMIYALGLIWLVAAIGGALVLAAPMLSLYETLGIESVAAHVVATSTLVLLLATSVTVALALVLRSHLAPAEVSARS